MQTHSDDDHKPEMVKLRGSVNPDVPDGEYELTRKTEDLRRQYAELEEKLGASDGGKLDAERYEAIKDVLPSEATARAHLDNLERRANQPGAAEASRITAGNPDECPLAMDERFGLRVVRMPDDPDCTRVSLGQVSSTTNSNYCVFRGDLKEVEKLLDRALRSVRSIMRRPKRNSGKWS